MAKAIFGEYSAFTTKNMVRYSKNNKLVSEAAVPTEVVAYLNKQLGYSKPVEPTPIPVQEAPVVTPAPRFPMPTEEEKARLRAESLIVKPELQGVNTIITEEDLAAPLTDEDFQNEYNPDEEPELAKAVEVAQAMTEKLAIEDLSPTSIDHIAYGGKDDMPVDSDFLEQVSIHTASIQDIAAAMYARFGVYTVYLDKMPENDEINPLTGEMFSKYHLGIAYQAAIRAQHTGIAYRKAEEGRMTINQNRDASSNFLDAFVTPPNTMAEARRGDTFDYRTSPQSTRTIATTEIRHETGADGIVRAVQVEIPQGQTGENNGARARFDVDEDEPILEPNFSGRPVIRPKW